MSQYHKNFPFGKGLWIWYIKQCLDGDINAIINKCHAYNISYLIIKGGNGTITWPQLTKEVVQAFHNANIKIYSFTYNFGEDPIKEAEVAKHCLSLGVDGHVFDAEGEYERVASNAQNAETMLKLVRQQYPDSFLAHAPFPIIDYHTKFPYVTFGKYCDAVMPQIYWGTMQRTPQQATIGMFDNFVRWQKNWIASGHADSVKPIIPLGQAYDNKVISPPYILNPADLKSFISIVKGYKSVNFWSFQHIERNDCWEAIRDTPLDTPSDADRGIVTPVEQPAPPVQHATEAPATPPVEQPAQETVLEEPVAQPVVEEVAPSVESTAPAGVEVVEQLPVETVPVEAAPTQTDAVEATPEETGTADFNQMFDIPKDKPTTIVLTPNDAHPNGLEVKVYPHQPTHRDMFVSFIRQLFTLLKAKVSRR